MKRFLSILTLAVTLSFSAANAFASDAAPLRVVELFTSQGCSSCPPANKFAGKIAKDSDTLVLSYGVTYWDYLGWKDTFAKPEFTRRQKSYARAFDTANVYTPQIVLNGAAHGSRYSKRDVHSMTLPAARPNISLVHENGALKVVRRNNQPLKSYSVSLVEYVEGPQSVPISKGENSGRVLTLTNVVTSVRSIGTWSDGDILNTGYAPKAGKSYAILLHDTGDMKLVSAARYAR